MATQWETNMKLLDSEEELTRMATYDELLVLYYFELAKNQFKQLKVA